MKIGEDISSDGIISHKNNIEKLILNYKRRLQKLKEQKALLGLHTPPDILIEIEDIEATIEELQTELVALEDNGNSEEPLRPRPEMASQRQVVISLDRDFPSLSKEVQEAAVRAFAAVMGIAPQSIIVHRISEGSIVFDLGIPPNAADRLSSRLESNSAHLRLHKVERVILERQPGKFEEWVFEGRKFHLVSSTNYPNLSFEYSLKDKFIINVKRAANFCVIILKGLVTVGSSLRVWIETKIRTKALTEAITKAEAREKALGEAKVESKVRAEAKALAKALVEVLQAETWFMDTAVSEIFARAESHAEAVALLLTKVEVRASAKTESQSLAEVKALAEARALVKALAEIETYPKSEGLAEDETEGKTQDEALVKARSMAETMATAIAQLKLWDASQPWPRRRAGVVAYRITADGQVEILLITARTDPKQWIFPVGTVDPGETLQQTAARECEEESGYIVKVGPELLEIPSEAGEPMTFFMAEIIRERAGYETDRKRKWVQPSELIQNITEDFLPIAQAALAKLGS